MTYSKTGTCFEEIAKGVTPCRSAVHDFVMLTDEAPLCRLAAWTRRVVGERLPAMVERGL